MQDRGDFVKTRSFPAFRLHMPASEGIVSVTGQAVQERLHVVSKNFCTVLLRGHGQNKDMV
jgi:hypothetical protein